MGTLTINGRKVKVDDSFARLTPEQQEATVNEIAAHMGAPKAETINPYQTGGAFKLTGKVADLPSQRPTLADEAMSFGRGVIEGIPIAGPMLSDARRALDANIGALFQGRPAEELQAQYKAGDEALAAKTGGARLAGNVTGSIAALAPLGMTAAGGRLLGTTGSLGQRAIAGGLSSGAITAADTAARGGSAEDAGTSGLIGTAIGAALPFVGAGIRRLVTPNPAPAAKTAAANVLAREGVDLTGGQRTGSEAMRFREAELGGNSASAFMDRQADQFTSAALRRVGVNSNRATPDVIDQAFTDIGAQFDDLAARNGLQTDPQFVNDISRAWQRFENVTNASSRPPFVERFLGDIAQRLQTGYAYLDGEWFKSTRSELNRIYRGTSNPEFKEAVGDIMAAMDDAMERSLAQVNPADLGAWREARRLYRNMFVIEDAATRAGEKAADGIITPQALRGAAIRQNKRAFARGRNEFTDLANAGVSTMTPLPNSGTAGRLSAKIPLPLGMGTGAMIGSQFGLTGALAGGALGAAAPWAIGRGMLSGPGRAYLGNQLLQGGERGLIPAAVPALEVTRR